jgi:hypothetical protein
MACVGPLVQNCVWINGTRVAGCVCPAPHHAVGAIVALAALMVITILAGGVNQNEIFTK